MILTTWNINGIRARESALLRRLERAEPEILCVQEIKARLEQIPPTFKSLANYETFWNPSLFKAGYSGVGFFVHKAIARKYGSPKFSIPDFDAENRLIQAEFDSFVALGFYAPRGAKDGHYAFKLSLFDKIQAHLQNLMKQGKEVVFAGDMNVAHKDIDLHPSQRDETSPGFRPEERAKIDNLLSIGLKDVFRDAHPNEEGLYSWWNYIPGFREKNIGWRIDCAYASPALASKVKRAVIETEEKSSDHAPVSIEFEW
ncbi:MAG: exodeoxyribonuclease III [Chloroherpetonaceae bacterium]|nr:exodeoxyribonuclease III [Chloroherpetonaceae bacterium]